jgi:2-hydroxychromene-2-carboxylate isomerase
MLLGAVFKITGQQPLVSVPMKGDYSKRDFERTARLHKVPFHYPEKFPINTVAAVRAFYWTQDQDPAKARALARALYRTYFVDGHDITSAEKVVEVARTVGIDGDALARALEDPAVKERTKREVDGAIAAGVFGSPYFIVDGEPFWGVDRLPMLEDWVKRGGW